MMPTLDVASLLLLAAIVGLIGTLLLARGAAPGMGDDADTAWNILLLATFLQAGASLGQALRGQLSPLFVFSAVNALQFLTLACLWFGVRRISGARQSGWLVLLPPAIWLAFCLHPDFLSSQQARIALFAPLSLLLLAGIVVELLRLHRREGLRAALDLALIIGMVVVGLVGLYVEALLFPRPSSDGWGAVGRLAALLIAIYGVTLPFLILAMRRERHRAALEARRAAALASGRAEVERLHQGLPAVIFLHECRPDGSVVLRYRGGDVEGVSGWPAARLAAPDGPLSRPSPEGWTLEGHIRRALQHGSVLEEWRLVQPDGSYRTYRSKTRILGRTADGGVELVGYALDVTQERRADAQAMATMRLASLGEMGKGLAHEVKQPLQALSLAAEVALLSLDNEAPPGIRQRLETVVEEARRAAEIIEHFRRFTRSAPSDAIPAALRLDEPVEGALNLVRAALEEADVRVELALGDPVPWVRGAAVPLGQVLVSLLLNARDAMAERAPGLPRVLRITAEHLPMAQVALGIADTGGGVAPEMLARLFEPFATTKGPDRGRGIALAAAYRMTRDMGGDLSATNSAQGAVFTVTLPALPPIGQAAPA